MKYFVAYENRPKKANERYIPRIMNAIIDEHPLIWIDRTTEAYRLAYVTYILFWVEVSDEVAANVMMVHIEGGAA